MNRHAHQHLLVDADDTLWENHAYFLEIHREFLDLMEERGYDRRVVTTTLRDIEARRTRTKGYGSINFAHSLIETVSRVNGGIEEKLRDELMGFGRWIHDHPIEVFPGVRETLEEMTGRHDLVLVTKGDAKEQHGKIIRSGLVDYFRAIEVLPEKTPEHYQDVIERNSVTREDGWMIGNSPRSDINPARRVGLRTVHIPHRSLWEFEVEEFDGQPDLVLQRFVELTVHF